MIASIVESFMMKIYYSMQRHYFSFRLLVWLKECGVLHFLKRFLLNYNRSVSYARRHPTVQMQESKKFFEANKERIDNILKILADSKSRDVFRAAIDFRENMTLMPKDLCSEHDQYFVKEIISLRENEVFIDGGAFIGDTIQRFINAAKRQGIDKIKYIIAFEPNKDNFNRLNKFFGRRKNCLLINKGLSDKEDCLLFFDHGSSSKLVSNEKEATLKIDVINIDAVPECREATFIKMDVEGAEMDALRGAEKTITANKPKLAISIYHSNEDMLRIAEYIHKLIPEYKLYVRHHSSRSTDETVLYAVC